MPRLGYEIAASIRSSQRRLDCGNPRCGFARIRCPHCGEERLLMFSCRTRGFCPSRHAKRLEERGEWMGRASSGCPPPHHIAYQEVLVAAETGGEYFS